MDDKIIQEDFKAELKHQLFYQMTRLTRDRGSLPFDDRLDALAIAVNYWVEVMDRDAEMALEDHKNYMLDQALEEFMESAGKLNSTHSPHRNWMYR